MPPITTRDHLIETGLARLEEPLVGLTAHLRAAEVAATASVPLRRATAIRRRRGDFDHVVLASALRGGVARRRLLEIWSLYEADVGRAGSADARVETVRRLVDVFVDAQDDTVPWLALCSRRADVPELAEELPAALGALADLLGVAMHGAMVGRGLRPRPPLTTGHIVWATTAAAHGMFAVSQILQWRREECERRVGTLMRSIVLSMTAPGAVDAPAPVPRDPWRAAPDLDPTSAAVAAAGERLLARDGICSPLHDLTVRHLATRASTSIGAVYHYWDSLESLHAELTLTYMARRTDALLDGLAGGYGPVSICAELRRWSRPAAHSALLVRSPPEMRPALATNLTSVIDAVAAAAARSEVPALDGVGEDMVALRLGFALVAGCEGDDLARSLAPNLSLGELTGALRLSPTWVSSPVGRPLRRPMPPV